MDVSKQLQFWIDKIDSITFVIDQYHVILAANKAFCHFFNFDCTNLTGQSGRSLSQKNKDFKKVHEIISKGDLNLSEDYIEIKNKWYYLKKEKLPEFSGVEYLIRFIEVDPFLQKPILSKANPKELFRILFEQSPEAIVLTTTDGRVVMLNKKFTQVFGYTLEELENQYIDNYLSSPEYRDKAETLTNRTANGQYIAEEAKRKNKKGQIIDVSILGAPVYMNNKLQFVYGIYRDITSRKQTEMQLGHSDKRFRDLFYKDKSIKILIDPDTSLIVDANDAALNFYGYSYSEMLKQFMFDINILPSEDIKKHMKEAESHGKNHFTFTHKLKNGEIRHVDVFSTPLQFGNKKLLYSTIYDITKKIQAEQDLRESEERYRLLAENTNDGVALFVGNVIYYASPSYFRILGYKDSELVGVSLDELFTRIHKDDRKKITEKLANGIQNEQNSFKYEYRVKNAKGEYIWVEDVVNVKYNKKGVRHSFVNTRDINDRKNIELNLEKQKENYLELATEYRKNNELLKEAKERAENSDRLKSAFLANLSHEVRTPINGISGFAELVQSSQIEDDKQHKFLEIIKDSSMQLLDIITNTVEMAKIETGQITLHPVKSNINKLIDELFERFEKKALQKNIKLLVQKDLPDNECFLILDAEKFKTIMSALISNAIKYTSEGKVIFGYKTVESKFTFFVEDTGLGIPEDRHEKIFATFTQGDEKRDRIYGGTGLGLSVARGMIEAMGSEVQIESEEERGTNIWFEINSSIIKESDKQSKLADKDQYTILIVEDDDASRQYLSQIFEFMQTDDLQLDVLVAENAVKARVLCQKNTIDLILMDVMLPDANGLDLAFQLKKQYENVNIIAQTAFAGADFRKTAMEKGCIDYVNKPISQDTLKRILDKYLE